MHLLLQGQLVNGIVKQTISIVVRRTNVTKDMTSRKKERIWFKYAEIIIIYNVAVLLFITKQSIYSLYKYIHVFSHTLLCLIKFLMFLMAFALCGVVKYLLNLSIIHVWLNVKPKLSFFRVHVFNAVAEVWTHINYSI